MNKQEHFRNYVENRMDLRLNPYLWHPKYNSLTGQILRAFANAEYVHDKGYKLSGAYIEYLGRENHCLDPMRALRRLRDLSQVKLECEHNGSGSRDYYLKVL